MKPKAILSEMGSSSVWEIADLECVKTFEVKEYLFQGGFILNLMSSLFIFPYIEEASASSAVMNCIIR